ncbi:Plug domain-containing protein [Tenacibaculum sp. 190524A02b]
MKIEQHLALIRLKMFSRENIFLMKLTFSIYLLFCLQLVAFNSFSQGKVTLNSKKEPIGVVLNQIEKQTSYSFVFNNSDIDISKKIDINVLNEDLDKVMPMLFDTAKINYQIKNGLIILSSKKRKNKNKEQQAKYTLSGTVKDAITGETLLGADVLIKGAEKGSVTNEYGFYSLTLPEGDYIIEVLYLGFATKQINIKLVSNVKLNIDLSPEENSLEEIIVTSNTNTKSQVKNVLTGSVNLKPDDIEKVPAFFGEPDITRVVLTQPGVSSVGEGTAGFNVRGGGIDQNLLLLDEAPLYNSSHLWGLFSVVNTETIKDIKFYKGGIPARFGGRGSSVLDMRQREGNSKSFRGRGGVGLLFSRLTLEGPIKKDKINYLVSGRRTYFDFLLPALQGEDANDNKLYFYDLSTKLTWQIDDNNKLFLSGYFGKDVMKAEYLRGDRFDIETGEYVKQPDGQIDFGWSNATLTLRWNHIFSSKLFMNASAIFSRYNYSLNSINAGGPSQVTQRLNSFKWSSNIDNYILKPDFTYFMDLDTKVRFGLHGTHYRFSPAEIDNQDDNGNNINFMTEKAFVAAPYGEVEKKWEKLSVNLGLRYSFFFNVGAQTVAEYIDGFPKSLNTISKEVNYSNGEIIKSYAGFEPRISLKYNIDDLKAFKFGYNRMYQYIHLISNSTAALPFDVWKLSGKHIKPLEVNQVAFGYAFDTPNKMFNFTIDSYYKDFNNLVEYINNAELFIKENLETQLLPAKGYSYGLELAAYKNKGKLTGNVNYTYSVSRRKTTSEFIHENINNGSYFASNYDKPHLLNAMLAYQITNCWRVETFFTYQAGRPTTLITGRINAIENENDFYLTYSDRNAYRLKDTHRMDLSITFEPKGNPDTSWQSSWGFGVYNLYGRKNVFSTYYNNSVNTSGANQLTRKEFSLLGAPIPFITYNFKF